VKIERRRSVLASAKQILVNTGKSGSRRCDFIIVFFRNTGAFDEG
jgi:hypothetical protein